jgi:hypothetical protein
MLREGISGCGEGAGSGPAALRPVGLAEHDASLAEHDPSRGERDASVVRPADALDVGNQLAAETQGQRRRAGFRRP